jgi:hypothetical protein
MEIEVKKFRSKESPPFHRYWQARFVPKKFGEHSPCEVRVRVYPEIGLSPYIQEDEARGAYAVAAGWVPFLPDGLYGDWKMLYEAIVKKATSSPSP